MNLQEAGDAPRNEGIRDSQPTGSVMTDGGTSTLESGFEPEVFRWTPRKMGHRISFAVVLMVDIKTIGIDLQIGFIPVLWIRKVDKHKVIKIFSPISY